MRFMMIVKANSDYEAGKPPSAKLMEAVGKLTQEENNARRVVIGGGLARSAEGVRVRASRGELIQVDGPFAESKELVGGFAILEYATREEAIEGGRRFMQVHVDVMGPTYEGELEIRQVLGPDDQDAPCR